MSKLTLQHIHGNSYFFNSVLSIGVYINQNKATLIDSGSDETWAKNISTTLEAAGYEIDSIINTHCHPDHCGGNAYLQKKYPQICIYATHAEQQFIEDPTLAPRCFCGLACPIQGLQNKYIAPEKPSIITHPIKIYEDQTITINNAPFTIVTLPGHTPGMIGIITPDNILYCGDALFGESTVAKHPVLFYTDIKQTLLSLAKIKSLSIEGCVLAHGGFVKDLTELIEKHITKITEIKNVILKALAEQSLSVDELTQKIMQQYNIGNNIVAFTLMQTTVRAYISYLESEKLIQITIVNGLLSIGLL